MSYQDYKQGYKRHCIKRALERYDLILTDEIYDFFMLQIKHLEPLSRELDEFRPTAVYLVEYENKQYKVVYHILYDCLITFIPRKYDNKEIRKHKKKIKKHFKLSGYRNCK